MGKILPLSDVIWRLGQVKQKPFGSVDDRAEVKEWLPAAVPGDVRLDLLRAGKIPDPFFGKDNEASQWVDGFDWWFLHDMDLEAAGEHTRRFVVFEGIDYQNAVYWNGVELGCHQGMFSRQVYEIPRELWQPRSQLAVRVWGSDALPGFDLNVRERLTQRVTNHFFPYNTAYADRLSTLKTQMSFGWDFAPRLRTCGIWDDVSLIETRGAFIRDAWTVGLPDGRVQLRATIDSDVEREAALRLRVRGKGFEAEETFDFPLTLAAGSEEYLLAFQLAAPRTWNPWDRGEPNLYKIECEVTEASGVLDTETVTLGLRTIDLEPNPGAPADEAPWTFVVNGVPEFIRGANWVPPDSMPGRATEQDYRALLEMARRANVNLLRVWGGGLREKRAFYDLCDELGILVWQEFPFSGAPLDHTRRDRKFLSFVREECGAMVRAIRSHPSVVLWCGGNEYNTLTNAPLVSTLREVVALLDGTRPFKPGSPSVGEHHNWRIWHWQANTRDYREDDAGFMGEFGLQAPPSIESLRQFIPAGKLWPPNDIWTYHNAELVKLWRYARGVNPKAETLEEFVAASQKAQLRGLQVMIEHARRNKGRTAGCAFWQLNEPWPAICWSVIDYYRRQKPAFGKIAELYNPVLLSFYYPLEPRGAGDRVSGEVWLINDRLEPVRGELRASLNGERLLSRLVEMGPNTAGIVAGLEASMGEGPNELVLELVDGDAVLSTNEYDLNHCDRGEIVKGLSPVQALVARLQS